MCCVLDVVGQPHTTFDKTILSSSRFLESYFVNMLFIIFGRCVYLSQSVPLIFPVTQVAILTHLCRILPHKGSIKKSQLSLRQEPIPFQSTYDFTIYLQCVRYLYHMPEPQLNNFFICCGGNTC